MLATTACSDPRLLQHPNNKTFGETKQSEATTNGNPNLSFANSFTKSNNDCGTKCNKVAMKPLAPGVGTCTSPPAADLINTNLIATTSPHLDDQADHNPTALEVSNETDHVSYKTCGISDRTTDSKNPNRRHNLPTNETVATEYETVDSFSIDVTLRRKGSKSKTSLKNLPIEISQRVKNLLERRSLDQSNTSAGMELAPTSKCHQVTM